MQGAAGRGSVYAPKAAAPPPKAPAVARGAAVTTPTPNQAAANAAANSNSSLQQYLAYTATNMGREAQSIINQETAPIIAGYTAQQKAGDQSIVGSTQTYVNELNGIASKAEGAYTTAEGQQQALDTAIGSALQGGDVGAAASRLTQALAAAGQNTAPGAAAQAAANSTGASQFASSSASLSQLFAQGANQTASDAQQPGLARNAGLQALSTYNAGLTSAEQAAVQAAQDKLPSIMSALNSEANTQLNAQKAQFSETLAANKANQPKIYGNSSTGYFALTADGKNIQLTAPGAKAPKVFGSASAGYYTIGTNGQTTQLTSPVPKAAPKAGAPHTKTVGGTTYQWNGSTWTKAPGIPGSKGTGGTLSPSQAETYVKSIVKTPTPSQQAKGVQSVYSANYTTAYKRLVQGGMGDVQARTLLDSYYPKGAGGRNWLTNEEQAVLKPYVHNQPMDMAGGLTAIKQIGVIGETTANGKKYGVLGANQAAILKAHNALPKGQFYHDPKLGNVYLIASDG